MVDKIVKKEHEMNFDEQMKLLSPQERQIVEDWQKQMSVWIYNHILAEAFKLGDDVNNEPEIK